MIVSGKAFLQITVKCRVTVGTVTIAAGDNLNVTNRPSFHSKSSAGFYFYRYRTGGFLFPRFFNSGLRGCHIGIAITREPFHCANSINLNHHIKHPLWLAVVCSGQLFTITHLTIPPKP